MGSSSVNSEIIVASIFLVGGGLAGFRGATFFFDARGARAEMTVIKLEDKFNRGHGINWEKYRLEG